MAYKIKLESVSNVTTCVKELCHICLDSKRKADQICVVEMPQDLVRIEEVCDLTGFIMSWVDVTLP